MLLVSISTAPLLVVYAQRACSARKLFTEPVLMMLPPPARRSAGIAHLAPRNGPRTFTAKMRSRSATVVSSSVPAIEMPAFEHHVVSLPHVDSARSTRPCTCASSDMSATTVCSEPDPAASTRRAVSSRPCPSRSAASTCAPSAAKTEAMPRPMPLPAPVTTATLPSSRPTSARDHTRNRHRRWCVVAAEGSVVAERVAHRDDSVGVRLPVVDDDDDPDDVERDHDRSCIADRRCQWRDERDHRQPQSCEEREDERGHAQDRDDHVLEDVELLASEAPVVAEARDVQDHVDRD